MLGLIKLWRRVRNGTADAYCVTCRGHRLVIKVRYVTQATSRGTKTRLEGICQTCEGHTSTFVAPI